VPRRRTTRAERPAWVLDECRALAHRIATLRATARLSQDQLAERTGLDRRSLQRYEAATRDPRYADLLLIAAALDVPIEDLVRQPRPAPRDQDRPGP
jgi:transcriptional regulator with XRE-family HTH domain